MVTRERRDSRQQVRIVGALVFAALYLQRIQVPGTDIPILLPVLLGLVVWLLLTSRAVIDMVGIVLLLMLVVCLLIETLY